MEQNNKNESLNQEKLPASKLELLIMSFSIEQLQLSLEVIKELIERKENEQNEKLRQQQEKQQEKPLSKSELIMMSLPEELSQTVMGTFQLFKEKQAEHLKNKQIQDQQKENQGEKPV